MNSQQPYAIGTHGQKWAASEKSTWFAQQIIKRSYKEDVVVKIQALANEFDVEQYGALSLNEERYPLWVVKSKNWSNDKATVLVTGGVHGYETSGVQGAIRFLETEAKNYTERFNIIVAPCISPWGYETINRWNFEAIDPNRSFYKNSPAEESAFLMQYITSLNIDIKVHIDLHETTDTDNSEFRPALAARDAVEHNNWNIPDGFYLVGNSINPAKEFQKAMITAVEEMTHVAPADIDGKLIGVPLSQKGVINYAARELGLCMGFTNAEFVTTTEVYPDSPKVDDENCVMAQVVVIGAGLDFVANKGSIT